MITNDISSIEAEAGVIASIILNPGFTFNSEQLTPHMFSNFANGYLYFAISELAKRNVDTIDAYNIINILHSRRTEHILSEKENIDDYISISSVQELIENAKLIARPTVEDYKIVAEAVVDCAFRRDTLSKLQQCEQLCYSSSCENIEQKIYDTLDDVMMKYTANKDLEMYPDVVDRMWEEIKLRQNPEALGAMKFPFPTLNNYVMIERGELVVFGACQKTGKSIFLANCMVDLLKQGCGVLYIDSELSTRLWTCRLISRLTGIDFKRVRNGQYSAEEEERISQAIAWIKQQSIVHVYLPLLTKQDMYSTFKKALHTMPRLDCVILDYLKSTDDIDAYASYASLGNISNCLKNEIAGAHNVAALAAAQATSTGKLADSARIARNASTIVMLTDKTQQEIEADGADCGNKKLRVLFNRNGAQMPSEDCYIDLDFDGNKILFTESKQHVMAVPY